MLLAPHHRSTAAEALRVVCCWLSLVLVLQGLAAAQWRGSGPLHRHRPAVPSAAAALLGAPAQAALQAHLHAHGLAERHHHHADDPTVLPAAEPQPDSLDPVAYALTAALALLAVGAVRTAGTQGRAEWRPGVRRMASSAWPALPYRPPRQR